MKRSLTITAVTLALAIGTASAATAAPLPLQNAGPVADSDTGSAYSGSSQALGLLSIPGFLASCLLSSISNERACNWF